MASSIAIPASPPDPQGGAARRTAGAHPVLGYAAGVAMVAAAGVVAFVVDHIVQAPNLSLVFVAPVIVAAVGFGWGPALVSALLSVAVFDFFFVEPRMSFQVASPTDLWALGLLLLVAAIASTVASESRRRALAASQAAAQAEALHALAHAVIRSEPYATVIGLAAQSLGAIFNAPAVVLRQAADKLDIASTSGGAQLAPADLEAAQWALANGKATRAETYPFDQAAFDFWPAPSMAGHRLVLGVRLSGRADGRPPAPDRQVELVAAYLAASAGR